MDKVIEIRCVRDDDELAGYKWEAHPAGEKGVYGSGWTPRDAVRQLLKIGPAHGFDFRWPECRMIGVSGEFRIDFTNMLAYRMTDAAGRNYEIVAATDIGVVGIAKEDPDRATWLIRVEPPIGVLLSLSNDAQWAPPGAWPYWSDDAPVFEWRYVRRAFDDRALRDVLESALVAVGYYVRLNSAFLPDDERTHEMVRMALYRPAMANGNPLPRERIPAGEEFSLLLDATLQAIQYAVAHRPAEIRVTDENAREAIENFLSRWLNQMVAANIADQISAELKNAPFGTPLRVCAVETVPSWPIQKFWYVNGQKCAEVQPGVFFVETD